MQERVKGTGMRQINDQQESKTQIASKQSTQQTDLVELIFKVSFLAEIIYII